MLFALCSCMPIVRALGGELFLQVCVQPYMRSHCRLFLPGPSSAWITQSERLPILQHLLIITYSISWCSFLQSCVQPYAQPLPSVLFRQAYRRYASREAKGFLYSTSC